jgi:fumarylacetoacetase
VSWLELDHTDPFGLANLPYGSFTRVAGGAGGAGGAYRVGVRVGASVLDVTAAERAGLLTAGGLFAEQSNLDGLLAAGRPVWTAVRSRLVELLTAPGHEAEVRPLLHPLTGLRLGLPFTVADYVDFYSSEYHATNVGEILRPGQPPLTPNWRHLPIGYHGRAGTVVVSGTDIVRPCGQRRPTGQDAPEFGPSTRLDLEVEVGFVVGAGTALGTPVSTADFRTHVFGAVLVNDWSARDIQAFEAQPLGPFLGKSFATSMSAWVVPLDALEAARVDPPEQDPPVQRYLREADRYSYDLNLELRLNTTVLTRPRLRDLYWTPAQQLAHLTVNGASLRPGDLFATGTISGPARDQLGCLLELSRGGAESITLDDGSSRTFLEDGDTVTISAGAPGPAGMMIGFGEVSGAIRPARSG